MNNYSSEQSEDTCFLLSNNNSASMNGVFAVSSSIKANVVGRAKLRSQSKLKAHITKSISFSSNLVVDTKLKVKRLDTIALHSKLKSSGNVKSKLSGIISQTANVSSESSISILHTDKLGAYSQHLKNIHGFAPNNKLYPIGDISNELDGNFFVNEYRQPECYSSIDEGVAVGNYHENFQVSTPTSDEHLTFITPSSLYTSGSFRYVCEVTRPTSTPVHSFLCFRAAAPTKNYASQIPPTYRIHNIFLKDPNDKTIIQYRDFVVRGDSNFDNYKEHNYTTYVSSSLVNATNLNFDDPNYPSLDITDSPYTLSFDVEIRCEDISFSDRFSEGYEQRACRLNDPFIADSGNNYLAFDGSPLSSQSLYYQINPSHHIRITAIEILNSGTPEGWLNARSSMDLNIAVPEKGNRITRSILPNKIELYNYNNEIYPTVNDDPPLSQNLWVNNDNSLDNTTASGCSDIVKILRLKEDEEYITLNYTSISSSGKLLLKFAHEPPRPVEKFIRGAFNIGFNSPNREFDYASFGQTQEVDSFFNIDEIFLSVIAKKDPASPDYTIDVVGYSDDKLLASTPQIGGFLQNIEGVGSEPLVSGFYPSNELAISAESISDKGEFLVRSALQNAGGDHYLVAQYADMSGSTQISSTEFEEYIIPLKIYKDSLNNYGHNCSLSSYFEHLYVDICPLPSGASIAHIALLATYPPSNAMTLYTLGYKDLEIGSADAKLFTSESKSTDPHYNRGPSYGPISQIENIPHAYTFNETFKQNYSRRWRNVDGLVAVGPFDFNSFDFSFYNPQLPKPFFGGYFSFNDDSGNNIISEPMLDLETVDGLYVGTYNKVSNIGLRFNTSSLFSHSTSYTTIDWTDNPNYTSDPLYGKIADAFDNAVRVNSNNGYISFPHFEMPSGCAIVVRFSPDVSMSGVSHNYYNSGIIFSKHDAGKDVEIALGYTNGFLTAYSTDSNGNPIVIYDDKPYYEYAYPLCAIVTYNNNNNGRLSLYTDDELNSFNFERLRAASDEYEIVQSDSSLTFGYSHGGDVGVDAFITDIAISAPSTQIINVPLSFNPSSFLDSIHNKYWEVGESYTQDTNKAWSYIDKNLDDWHLGDFNICEFNLAFDRFTSRFGKDFITHRVKNDGIAYQNKTDISLPSNVDSESSYHTQIENDMLRLPLSPKNNSFASLNVMENIRPRIANSFVRGYHIFEEAFVVDTVLEHVTYNDIIWNDGNVGPKLVVSLYTPSKNNPDMPYQNMGLINRSIHYLEPSGCIHKISSKFSFDDLFDQDGEDWYLFDQRLNPSELDNKYLARDIDEMFLQYDIVYPSGEPYDSSITIYGTTITLTEALHRARTINNL